MPSEFSCLFPRGRKGLLLLLLLIAGLVSESEKKGFLLISFAFFGKKGFSILDEDLLSGKKGLLFS